VNSVATEASQWMFTFLGMLDGELIHTFAWLKIPVYASAKWCGVDFETHVHLDASTLFQTIFKLYW
jgi:hypothetical protein